MSVIVKLNAKLGLNTFVVSSQHLWLALVESGDLCTRRDVVDFCLNKRRIGSNDGKVGRTHMGTQEDGKR